MASAGIGIVEAMLQRYNYLHYLLFILRGTVRYISHCVLLIMNCGISYLCIPFGHGFLSYLCILFQKVGLMILDEIHLLGADRGPILEVFTHEHLNL